MHARLDFVFVVHVAARPCRVYRREEEGDRRERTGRIPGNGKFTVEARGVRRRILRAIALVIGLPLVNLSSGSRMLAVSLRKLANERHTRNISKIIAILYPVAKL